MTNIQDADGLHHILQPFLFKAEFFYAVIKNLFKLLLIRFIFENFLGGKTVTEYLLRIFHTILSDKLVSINFFWTLFETLGVGPRFT